MPQRLRSIYVLGLESNGDMVDRFVSYVTGPAPAAGEPGAVIRTDSDGASEMVNLIWGFEPPERGARPVTLLRSEWWDGGGRRCLIPGSQFTVSKGLRTERRRWRVTLSGSDSHFYFAGLWRPAKLGWPACYAMLTVPASADIAPFQERQPAVIRMRNAKAWLDGAIPKENILAPHPAGTFCLRQIDGPVGQAAFAW